MNVLLSLQECEACNKNSLPIVANELPLLLKEVPDWTLTTENKVMMIKRSYYFKNYKLAWDFSNKISELAEKERHHPSIILEWGKVTVTWWTHTIGGLHKNDLICAAKTDIIGK